MIADNKYLLMGAAVAGLALAYVVYRTGSKVATALNPMDSNNIINQGVTGFYQAVTGSTGSIGTDIYDATHGGGLDITSDNNFIYNGVSGLGGAVSGNKDWSLGTWLYDVTH